MPLKDNTSKSPHPLPAAREGGHAEPAEKVEFVRLDAGSTVSGLGSFFRGIPCTNGRGDQRRCAELEPHVSLHPFEVPAPRSARHRPDCGHRFGQLQRCLHAGQRREHDPIRGDRRVAESTSPSSTGCGITTTSEPDGWSSCCASSPNANPGREPLPLRGRELDARSTSPARSAANGSRCSQTWRFQGT